MRLTARLLALTLALLLPSLSFTPGSYAFRPSKEVPPEPAREFRGAWVATVANIDWPSKPGLTSEQQMAELTSILDTAQRLNLNAIVLQVRPACDALYDSHLEPWSEYLTGSMGQPPNPPYDPLKFAIDEAHRRGIELHAWFNPFRARHNDARSPIAPSHVSVKHSNFVRAYGSSLWLDPSEKGVQDYSIDVIMDVVSRYDIDGVHIDDYFYPYKEKGPDGKVLDFPDDANWQKYQQSNGRLSRDDWRRDQVDRFIERLYKSIKHRKPWVKVGISPFGIWRPGSPATVRGFDAYKEIYADSRRWLNEGWLDYWSPQLYWKQDQTGQRYSDLLQWWIGQNTKGRHIWPGNYTSRVGDGSRTSWPADEIAQQVDVTRRHAGAGGNLHFSMKALLQDRAGVASLLSSREYSEPALVPASPWLQRESLGAPRIYLEQDPYTGGANLMWKAGKGKTWLWLLQAKRRTSWKSLVLPAETKSQELTGLISGSRPAVVALTPVDRCGNLGPRTVIEVEDAAAMTRPDMGVTAQSGFSSNSSVGRPAP